MGRLDSPHLRKTRRIHVATKELELDTRGGFQKLRGILWYIPVDRSVTTYIAATTALENKGPPVDRHENVPWPAGGGDFKGMREHLEAKLREFSLRMTSLEIPARADCITKCNVAGESAESFAERVCSECICWYCERSSAFRPVR